MKGHTYDGDVVAVVRSQREDSDDWFECSEVVHEWIVEGEVNFLEGLPTLDLSGTNFLPPHYRLGRLKVALRTHSSMVDRFVLRISSSTWECLKVHQHLSPSLAASKVPVSYDQNLHSTLTHSLRRMSSQMLRPRGENHLQLPSRSLK